MIKDVNVSHLHAGDNDRRECKHSCDGFSTRSLQKYLALIAGNVNGMCSNAAGFTGKNIIGSEAGRLRMHRVGGFTGCEH